MRTLAKSLCVRWPSVNARAGQILCVPTTNNDNKEVLTKDELMLKYLLDNLEEQKRVKIKEGNSLE